MACQSSSLVRAAALRTSAVRLANSCSIGFRSGPRRQVEDGGAGGNDRLADGVDLVCRQLIEHHDIAGSSAGARHCST